MPLFAAGGPVTGARNEGVPDKVLRFTEDVVHELNLEECVQVHQAGTRQNGERKGPSRPVLPLERFCTGLKYL